MSIEPTEGCGSCAGTPIEINLTVAEQKKLVEAETGEPCFRMWMTAEERETIGFADWTTYKLEDGRYAMWRTESSVQKMMTENIVIWREISARRLPDDVT